MKISQEKKAEVRKALIEAAAEIMGEKGFSSASMREIARKAGVGDATIYSYFPTKEKILYGYFEEKLAGSIAGIKAVEGFGDYTFQEKLQELLETNLSGLLADREFVGETVRLAFIAPIGKFSDASRARSMLIDAAGEFLQEAIANGEINEPPIAGIVTALFWEYYLGILMYWLQDDSEDFARTTQLIDASLGLILAFLRSEILVRASDLFTFFLRNHMYGALELLGGTLLSARERDESPAQNSAGEDANGG